MKRPLALAALALLLLTLAGCRSSRQAAGTASTPEQRREYTVMTFSATADGISVNGQVRMARDSVIWVSVNKFIEVGRALATTDSIWVRSMLLPQPMAGDYRDLKRKAKLDLSFDDLQAILLADDAERRIAALAKRMGYDATVKITRRENPSSLTFPFKKEQ